MTHRASSRDRHTNPPSQGPTTGIELTHRCDTQTVSPSARRSATSTSVRHEEIPKHLIVVLPECWRRPVLRLGQFDRPRNLHHWFRSNGRMLGLPEESARVELRVVVHRGSIVHRAGCDSSSLQALHHVVRSRTSGERARGTGDRDDPSRVSRTSDRAQRGASPPSAPAVRDLLQRHSLTPLAGPRATFVASAASTGEHACSERQCSRDFTTSTTGLPDVGRSFRAPHPQCDSASRLAKYSSNTRSGVHLESGYTCHLA